MKIFSIVTAVAAAVAVAAALCAPHAMAQDSAYPQHPVKVIVPFPPGQATDIIGRLVAQKLSEKWKQPVFVENRAGAGGISGVDVAAKAPPDGYTLLVAGSGPLSISPAINATLPYSPLRDLLPLSNVAAMPMVLVSAPGFQARTLAEFLAILKSKADLSYASSGTGSTGQMATELMLSQSQTKMVHVPYRGGPQALTDVMGGRVPVTIESQAAVLPLIKGGKLSAIAVTSGKRSSKLPTTPTFAESGLPGFDISAWIGVLAPVGLPPAIAKKIADDLAEIVAAKDVQDKIGDLGLEPMPMNAERFSAHIRQETEKYNAIAKAANIRAE